MRAQFAASQGIDESRVTHCVRIGRRGLADVYAVGWWLATEPYYCTAIAEHDGERWGEMTFTYDRDITR